MLCQYIYGDFPLAVHINCDNVYLRWDVFRYIYASCVLLFRWEIFTCAAANITLQSTLYYWLQQNFSLETAYQYRAIGKRQ